MWKLQNYLTTVLNERMWHFGGQNVRWLLLHNSGGHDPQLPRSPVKRNDLTCHLYGIHETAHRHIIDVLYWEVLDGALVLGFNDNALYKFTFCTIHYAIVPLKQAVYCVASLYGGIMTDPSAVYVCSLMVWPAWHEQWPTIRRMSPEKKTNWSEQPST